MRILVLHNRYRIEGGEDVAVRREVTMLRHAGATVELLEVSNGAITGLRQSALAAINLTYSFRSRALVRARIARFRPDLVHVHNFFPVLTPAIYDADACIPFVQTLHNYRLLCSNALLFREDRPCEQCLGKSIPWPAIYHGCYRCSHLGSAAVAFMSVIHRCRDTWNSRVAHWIVLTEFAGSLFVQYLGLDPDRVTVKANSAPDTGPGDRQGGYALYVGRLSVEKGIATLLTAARCGLGMPLKVAGTGPLSGSVERAARQGILEYLGPRSPAEVSRLMQGARALLLPSSWYEGLPLVIPEAFATGLPIIASNLGALASLVTHERNGILAPCGDAQAIAQAVRRIAAAPEFERSLRRAARLTYEQKYRPEANVKILLEIYRSALSDSRRRTMNPCRK